MLIRRKTLLIGMSLIVLGFSWGDIYAQSQGPAAFAAKLRIKDDVLRAMDDGKISATERSDILYEAKDILAPQEYAGLVRTLKRLSSTQPGTQADLERDIAVPHSIAASHPVMKRMLTEIPYVQESQLQIPPVRNVLPHLSYVKPPEMSVAAEADKIVARLPRLYDIYLEPPSWYKQSQEQLYAKSSKAQSAPPSIAKAKTQTRVVASEKQAKPKKTEQSAKNNPPNAKQVTAQEASKLKQVTIQDPATWWKIVERPVISRPHTDYSVPVLTTPAAALLSDRNSAAMKVSYDEPMAAEHNRNLIRQ